MNSISIDGALTGREAVRFTPAGLEVFEGTFHHRGTLVEAGKTRTLEYDFPAISFAETAKQLNKLPLGAELRIKGFIAPRSMKSSRLVIHITEFN